MEILMICKLIILFKLARKVAKSDILNISSKFKKPPLVIKLFFQLLSFSFQKKDQNQQVELLNEILKELNEIKFSKKIDKLENKLMKEFDEKSYSDLIQLKSQINKE